MPIFVIRVVVVVISVKIVGKIFVLLDSWLRNFAAQSEPKVFIEIYNQPMSMSRV